METGHYGFKSIITAVLITVLSGIVGMIPVHGAEIAPEPEKRNLLEDGASFEVGVDGFNLNNQYLLSHHGKEIEPVFDDSTAVHGKYSLRLDNPLGDKIYVAFRPMRVSKRTQVTVSGYLKGDGKARIQLMRWPWKAVARLEVILTPEWRRFSFEAAIKNDEAYFLWILPGIADTKRIWIDALQIEEGGLSEFISKPLEFSLRSTAFCNTYEVGEECALVVRVYAEKPAPVVQVTVKVLDIFQNEILNKTVNVEMRGKNHAEAAVPLFKGDRRGSYKVIAEAKMGKYTEKEIITFGVLKPVPEPDPFFGFQVKHIFNDDAERRIKENNVQRELVYSNADPRYINRLIRMVGASSIRCFRTAEFHNLVQESGKYIFRDAWLKLQKDDGLSDPLIILNARPPRWMKTIPVGEKVIPTMESWKDYVRTYVAHYKGKTRYYEVVNEPETIFGKAEVYVPYLKAAYEIIHEVDANAMVVAPSYSGSRPFEWIEGFVKAGGHKYTDIWAIHYAGRTFPELGMDRKTPTWELIHKYRSMLVNANDGKDKPFWNTEGGSIYWVEEYDHWPRPSESKYVHTNEHRVARNASLAAAYVARLQLIEKASGIDRLYSFEFGFYYSTNASKSRDQRSRYVNYDGSPSPALVAYNAVAELFADTKPIELLPLEHSLVAVVFERNGKAIGGVWKGAPMGEWSGFEKYDPVVYVDVALTPEKLNLVNMLGHPVTPQASNNGVRLEATAYPLYFTSDLAPSDVVAAFKEAALTLGTQPSVDRTYKELVEEKYYSPAIVMLKERLAKSQKDDVTLSRIGKCYLEIQRTEDAKTHFEKALEINPNSIEANAGMGRYYHDLAQAKKLPWWEGLNKAGTYFSRAVDTRGWNGTTYEDLELYYYCWYCVGHKDPTKALKCINAAEKIASNNFRVKRMVGSRERLKKLVDKLQQQEQKKK